MLGLTIGQQVIAGLITASSAIIVAILSYIGGRGSVSAQLQAQLNDSFKRFTDALTQDLAAERGKRIKLEGEINQLRQHIWSLENLLRRAGINIPSYPAPEAYTIMSGKSELERYEDDRPAGGGTHS